MFNNNGVNKPQQGLATVDRNASVTATVSISGQPLRSAIDWISDKTLQINKTPNAVEVVLPPGGIASVLAGNPLILLLRQAISKTQATVSTHVFFSGKFFR